MDKKHFPFALIILVTFIFSMVSCGGDDDPKEKKPVVKPAVTVDLTNNQQVIRGFGGATAFRADQPISDQDMDKLFGTDEGEIGLNILRIRVATDDQWRGLELAHAKKAKARGAIVVASPWSPPAEMKTNGELIGGSLKPESYEDYANYLNDFATYMAENDVPLYAISIQNEPDIPVEYESCDWTGSQIRDFLKGYGSIINANTPVIAPESFNFNHAMSDPLLNDAEAAANVDIIGGHIYGGGLRNYPLAESKGKEVWMTEHLDTEVTWANVLATGKEIHDCLAEANFNAYIWWYLKRFYGPLGEDGAVTKRGYIMANYAKFIRPGYHRVSIEGTPRPNLNISAYNGDKAVIVVVNTGTAAISQRFVFENGAVNAVSPYITSATRDLEKAESVSVSAESSDFTYTIPGESVVTFVEE